jgi:hypothetical protein
MSGLPGRVCRAGTPEPGGKTRSVPYAARGPQQGRRTSAAMHRGNGTTTETGTTRTGGTHDQATRSRCILSVGFARRPRTGRCLGPERGTGPRTGAGETRKPSPKGWGHRRHRAAPLDPRTGHPGRSPRSRKSHSRTSARHGNCRSGSSGAGLNLIAGESGRTRISIRGIQTAGESTVGLYYGETPLTGPSGTTSDPSG